MRMNIEERQRRFGPLADVVEFLTDPARAAERAAALAHEGGEVEATCAMMGTILSDRLEDVNARLASLESAAGRDDRAGRAAAVEDARSIHDALGAMREALDVESMRPVLAKATKLSQGAGGEVVAMLDEERAFFGERRRELAEAFGARDSFAALRESPAMRRAVDNKAPLQAGADDFHGPLLRCFAEEFGSSQRAEMAAKIELYIESGHARQDSVGGLRETDAARAMRELLAPAAMAGADGGQPPIPSSAEVKAVVEARFDELFVRARVARVARDGMDDDYALTLADANGMPYKRGVSGLVDAVIRDARDPSLIRCAIVTAGKDTSIENTQVLRHTRAVQRAVAGEELSAGGPLVGVSRAAVSFYAASSLYASNGEAQGRRASLGDGLTNRTKDKLTEREREALNTLPLLSVLAEVGSGAQAMRPGLLASVESRLFGAPTGVWNEAMAAARLLPEGRDRDRAVVAAAAKVAGEAIDVMAKIDAGEQGLKTSNDFFKKLLKSFNSTLKGATRHGAEFPEVLAPIQSRMGTLREFRAQLAGDAPEKSDLRDIVAIYNRRGGVAAWAETMREEERDAALSLAGRRSSRDADLAATKAFIDDFALGRPNAPLIEGLAGDARSDGLATLGFSMSESRAIADRLERMAERARRDGALMEAAEAGDVPQAKEAILKGADPEAVDRIGRSASEVAHAAGWPKAARELGEITRAAIELRFMARLAAAARLRPATQSSAPG